MSEFNILTMGTILICKRLATMDILNFMPRFWDYVSIIYFW